MRACVLNEDHMQEGRNENCSAARLDPAPSVAAAAAYLNQYKCRVGFAASIFSFANHNTPPRSRVPTYAQELSPHHSL